jgi:hypothetical protein
VGYSGVLPVVTRSSGTATKHYNIAAILTSSDDDLEKSDCSDKAAKDIESAADEKNPFSNTYRSSTLYSDNLRYKAAPRDLPWT